MSLAGIMIDMSDNLLCVPEALYTWAVSSENSGILYLAFMYGDLWHQTVASDWRCELDFILMSLAPSTVQGTQ